ncbi:N-methylhydantoinase A [[Actinomadura] parvosata subsp. kistnae]|nr:N-methylhydantoinase A [Actinomadura parvosata subsp. kistnae]
MGYAIGVDVGGTFTDVVLKDTSGAISVAKCLSTHYDPIAGILTGVTRVLAGRDPAQVTRVVHATTLATNAVLERKGVRVAFVTTQGFRAAVPLGRYARVEEDRYDLRFTPPPPPVAPGDCFEVVERVSARGAVLTPLDPDSVRRAAAAITARGIESAAVCLLHAYANPAHERRVAEILRETVPAVVTSSETWPELREYERATTTIMSAYIGPLMASYLSRLRERLAGIGIRAPVHVMESSGGVISAELAARRAVATIESGPAAGVLAAAGAGFADAISFDMGGTTAKTCVVRGGRPEITHEFHVGGKGSFGGRRAGTGVPIKTPAIDLAEVGAGGGSVAWLDPPAPCASAPAPPAPPPARLLRPRRLRTHRHRRQPRPRLPLLRLHPPLARTRGQGSGPARLTARRHPRAGRVRRARDRQRLHGVGGPRRHRATRHRPPRLRPRRLRRRRPHARRPHRRPLRHHHRRGPRPLRRRLRRRPPVRRPVHRPRPVPPRRPRPRRPAHHPRRSRRHRPRRPPRNPRGAGPPLGGRPLQRPVPRPDRGLVRRPGRTGVALLPPVRGGVRDHATRRDRTGQLPRPRLRPRRPPGEHAGGRRVRAHHARHQHPRGPRARKHHAQRQRARR